MTFPHERLDLHVELYLLGAWVEMAAYQIVLDDAYSDVYSDVYGGRRKWVENRLMDYPTVTFGRKDESSRTGPASVSFTVDNNDGALTPGNPLSPYWPDVQRGILCRIRVGDALRFTGKVAEIHPFWPHRDMSDDTSDGEARVLFTASGQLRRIGQSQTPQSALYRKITRDTAVTDYWPLEDSQVLGAVQDTANTSTSSPSGLLDRSRPAMLLENVETGAASPIAGAAGMASVRSGSTAKWNVPLQGPTSGAWNVGVMFQCPTAPEATEIVRVMDVFTSGDPYRWVVDLNWNTTPELLFQGFYQDGSLAFAYTTQPYAVFGLPVLMELTVSQSGGNVVHDLRWQEVISDHAYGVPTTPVAGTSGQPKNFSGTAENCPAGGYLFGQVTVRDGVENYWALTAAQGHNGERAGTRLIRLCAEEGVVLSIAGSADTTKMGPQPVARFADLLGDCEAADGGMQFERRTSFGLQYLGRASLYNKTPELVLDAALSQIANPFTPIEDDQGVTNDVTVKNTNGSSYRARDEDSIESEGVYDTSLNLNLYSDSLTLDAAGWHLHLGTWKGMRVPAITFDFGAMGDPTDLIAAWVLLSPGDRVSVLNLPPQMPADSLDLMFLGWSETFGPFDWKVTANCIPYEPWIVGVVEDVVLGRVDTAGSELATAIDADDTSLSVATTAGDVWTTYGLTFPFDVKLGNAEVVTVTGIAGTSSPQTFTLSARGVNGITKSHAAGVSVSLAHPAVLAR